MTENKKKVLVLEDELPLLGVIRTQLESAGFDVEPVRNVDSGLKVLEKGGVDVIWLDHYLLGKQDGLDLVVKLKAPDSKWKKIPVFVVSNTASPNKVQSYVRLGVNKYFTKSEARLDKVVAEINRYLQEEIGE